MMGLGYDNVKTVEGGGQAMEKYFMYYRNGKLINPMR
jgi:hypothetical protein